DTDSEIDAAFATVSQERLGALAVAGSPFFDTRRDKVVALAARDSVATMYHSREFTEAGGLISYGISFPDLYRHVGANAGRILRGPNLGIYPFSGPPNLSCHQSYYSQGARPYHSAVARHPGQRADRVVLRFVHADCCICSQQQLTTGVGYPTPLRCSI